MVPKVQGFISFFLIFLKSESSPVEGTGDERHVHAPQTRWRLSKPMPEGAHPCFGVESVSPRHSRADCWPCAWQRWNRLLFRALWKIIHSQKEMDAGLSERDSSGAWMWEPRAQHFHSGVLHRLMEFFGAGMAEPLHCERNLFTIW